MVRIITNIINRIAGVPWDGSYPWRGSGVSTKFSNGDVFQVWINSAIKDWDESKSYAGDAVHTYDPNGFKCWAEHSKPVFTLADGTRCTSAYICWHEPKGSGSSGSGDTNKPPTKYVTKPEFTMSSKDVSVRVQGTTQDENNWNPTRAFSHIHDAIEGVQCRKQAYAIGNDCSISFDCTFTLPDQTGPLTKILTDAVAPAVVGTKTTKKGHYAGKCPPQGGPCDPGYDFTWTEYEYPMTGKVLVSVYPEGNPGASSLQSEIGWSVECKNSGFCGAFCHNNGVHIANVASNIAGVVPVGSVICMFC